MPAVRTGVVVLVLGACIAPPSSDAVADAGDTGDSAVVVDTGGPQGPLPTGPVDGDVHSVLPDDYVARAPVRLVVMGDSISARAGASRDAVAYTRLLQDNATDAWPAYDDIDLQTAFPSITEVIDVSKGGATVPTMRSQQLPKLVEALGDTPAAGETVVVYTVGGNDAVAALTDLANLEDNLTSLVDGYGDLADEVRSLFADDVFLYVTNVYEPTDGTGDSDGNCFEGIPFALALPLLDGLNADLAAEGEARGFAVLDLHGHFQGHGFQHDAPAIDAYDADDPTMWFRDDCIHPNDRGHHEVRRLFFAGLVGEPLRLETE